MTVNYKHIFLIYFICFNLTACYKTSDNIKAEPPPERIVLGFAQIGDESEWRTVSSNDIKKSAEKAGVQLIFENAQQQQFNQIKAIRSFIVNRVDVIAFSPIVEEGWDNILLEAKTANIPVILVDRSIKTEEKDLYCAFIGSDFHREGKNAGEWIIKKFKNNEGPIKIAEISGTVNSTPAIGRHEGLLDALKNEPKFEIVTSVSGDFMRSKGMESMESILKETPDFDLIYAHNDDMAVGAIEILEEHGIDPKKDVVIVSFDAQKSGLEALKEGKIKCLIECSPYVGTQLMDLVVKVANNEYVPKLTYTDEKIFTETDNLYSLPKIE